MGKVKEERKCSIDGCGKKHRSKGFCLHHWKEDRKVNGPFCSIDGCSKPFYGNGLCEMHYARFRKKGAVGAIKPLIQRSETGKCTVSGCENDHKSKGYCEIHYDSFKRTGDPLRAKRKPPPKTGKCKEDGCDKTEKIMGYCRNHYQNRIYINGEKGKLTRQKWLNSERHREVQNSEEKNKETPLLYEK